MKYILFLIIPFLGLSQKINTELAYLVHESKAKANPPVIIMLHGYGSNEADLFDISNSFDERFITFSIRAPYPTTEGGNAWYDLKFLPNKQISCNYEQLKVSKAKILSFISNACKTYKADSTKVFIMGFSQGAIMGYDIALTHPTKISGVLALSGRLLEETKNAKLDDKTITKLKFYIAHGYSDNVIDIKEAEKANEFLKSKKITEVSYKNYEMPHSICGDELNDIKKWLKKNIDPAPKVK